MRARRLFSAIAVVLAAAAIAHAQPAERPRAEVTPVVGSAPVRAGTPLRVSLQVRLPRDIHVQANKPRDPSLIPTVLTVTPPTGVTVEEITYPPPMELAQKNRRDRLAVLGPEFSIEVRLVLASTVPPGELAIPAVLRYQACNDSVCFPPARAATEWSVNVTAPPLFSR